MNTEQLKADTEILNEYGIDLVNTDDHFNGQLLQAMNSFASQESKKAVKEYKEKLEKELILLDAGAAASDYSALHAIRHIRKLIDSL